MKLDFNNSRIRISIQIPLLSFMLFCQSPKHFKDLRSVQKYLKCMANVHIKQLVFSRISIVK
ncbi:hypothetical protein EHQ50_02350 [Leptospira meyeri]|nr:hypothetical protein EHQ50_02350 [Leptospira meyeri]